MFERFSDTLREAMRRGRETAERNMEPAMHTGHMLLGIIRSGAYREVECLSSSPAVADRLERRVDQPLPARAARVWRRRIRLSGDQNRCIEQALRRARGRGSPSISVADVLFGIISTAPNAGEELLQQLGVDMASLCREVGNEIPTVAGAVASEPH